jgi:hypothetical protein
MALQGDKTGFHSVMEVSFMARDGDGAFNGHVE